MSINHKVIDVGNVGSRSSGGFVMTKRQIARMVFMLGIAILLVLSVFGYGCEIGNVMKPIDYASDVTVDRADMTAIVNMIIFGTNGLLAVITSAVYCMAILIIALVLLLPWRLISIRKQSVIAPIEMKVVRVTYVVMLILSLVFGFVGAQFSSLLSILALTLVVATSFGLLCVLPYCQACGRSTSS